MQRREAVKEGCNGKYIYICMGGKVVKIEGVG